MSVYFKPSACCYRTVRLSSFSLCDKVEILQLFTHMAEIEYLVVVFFYSVRHGCDTVIASRNLDKLKEVIPHT